MAEAGWESERGRGHEDNSLPQGARPLPPSPSLAPHPPKQENAAGPTKVSAGTVSSYPPRIFCRSPGGPLAILGVGTWAVSIRILPEGAGVQHITDFLRQAAAGDKAAINQ